MNTSKFKMVLAVMGLSFVGASTFAETSLKPNSRKRESAVVSKVDAQIAKNNIAVEQKKLTPEQGKRLDQKDEQIKTEASNAAAENGGKLTHQEARKLKREEKQLGRERTRLEKKNRKSGVPVPLESPQSGVPVQSGQTQ